MWLKRKVQAEAATCDIDATSASGQRQTILGFGGSFTDSAAYASSLLPPNLAHAWRSLYFAQEGGAGFTMGRVPFGGADFSRKWLLPAPRYYDALGLTLAGM